MSLDRISPVDDLKTAIQNFANTYTPSDEIIEHIKSITIVPIIGPFAVGKTTLIGEVESRYTDFGHSQGFTTRERRQGEDPDTYRFLEENRLNLNGILNDMYERDFVQVAVHPASRVIYGSSPEDYQSPFTMLDTLSNSMKDIKRTGFGDVKPIGLVAPFLNWQSRLDERVKQISSTEFKNRMVEAKHSLRWLLDQGPDFPWLVNADGQLCETADKLVGVVTLNEETDPDNRKVGEEILKFLNSDM
jgi:guanylate kinase